MRPTDPSARFVLFAGLLLSLACGSPPPELGAIPHPGLESIDATARAEIEAARSRLETLPAETSTIARAEATGELGRLYQAYGFDAAARAAYANAVALAPQSFRWLYLLGILELERGDLEHGRRHLEAALALRPGNTPTLLALARAALDRADLERAADLYRRAAESSPDCAAAPFGLGLAALEAERPTEAIAAFERALELDPEASQIHRPLAMAHRANGDLAAARRHLARAGTTAPTCPDPLRAELAEVASGASALYERASRARIEGRDDLALELTRRAITADPRHAAAHRLLGSLLIEAGAVVEALTTLEEAAALEPDDRRTHLLLGRAHRADGDLAASTRALERAVELDPLDAGAHAELARTAIERGAWPAARAHLETALGLDPDDTDLAVQHARALAATGEKEAARRQLEAIVERRPDAALVKVALGTLAAESGDLASAEEELSRALAAEGSADTYALAHFHLARLRAARGEEELAGRHLETALELAPGFVEARLARADLALAAGRHADAARRFARLAAQRPDLVEVHTGWALALLGSGRHLEARRVLEAAWRGLPEALPIAHLLARVLATAPAPRVRDGSRAVELAAGLFERQPSLPHGETVAMALAAAGRWDEAIAWQRRLLDESRAAGAPPETVARLEGRLTDYRHGRAPRAAWRQ